MPKKKPIAKRLNKLFDDIKQEEPSAEIEARSSRRAVRKTTKAAVQAKPSTRRAPQVESGPVTQTDTALALAFQMGQNNWATLQVLDETNQRKWSEDEQLLVKQVADQLSLALENARLFQETQRRAQEMTALAAVGREISATLNLETVLERIVAYAKNLLQAESSAVYLPNPDFQMWRAISAVGLDAEEIKSDPIHSGRGILGNIAINKVGRIVNDASRDPEAITVAGTQSNSYEHIMGTPILSQDRVTGLMAVWRTGEGKDFQPVELDFLNSLAQQAAIAIENARLFQSVANSQAQLSETLHIARIGYFEIDLNTNAITFTDELFTLLNTSAEKEGGHQFPLEETLQKFVVSEDIPIATQAVNNAINSRSGQSDVTSEVRYRTLDGRIIWVSSVYKVERNANGEAIKIAGSSQDITDRKTNELTQSAITQISEKALTAKTLEELIEVVYDSIQTLLPAKNFYLALYDRSSNQISFPYHVAEFAW